jgi:hypothetical protein
LRAWRPGWGKQIALAPRQPFPRQRLGGDKAPSRLLEGNSAAKCENSCTKGEINSPERDKSPVSYSIQTLFIGMLWQQTCQYVMQLTAS